MKRSIMNQLTQLSEQQQGYVAGMTFRYMNLCVKAEVASLLPVQVVVEGKANHIEDVAYVGQKEEDEYSLYIFPKFDDDMYAIAQAVKMRHPEFKQKIESQKVDPGDGSQHEVKYLRVIMPEVDDNRHDALKQAVDTFYQKCKGEMEAAQKKATAQMAVLGADESPLVMDEVKKNMDEINDTWNKQREKLHEDKVKEIEEAYANWMTGQTAKKEEEQNAAAESSVATSMHLTPEEEE